VSAFLLGLIPFGSPPTKPMKPHPSVAVYLIPALAAIIVAMVSGGGILANAFQGNANDKDRQIAILTAERDQLISMLLTARRVGGHYARRATRAREGGWSVPADEEMTARDSSLAKIEVFAQLDSAVKSDTFRAKPTFLGTKPQRLMRAARKKGQ